LGRLQYAKARLASDDNFVALHHHEKAHADLQSSDPHPPLTALQEFGTRLVWLAEEDLKAESNPIGGSPLVAQRISDSEVSGRRLRMFLANRAIALGWALKGSCKPCSHRLFTTARWLVPEAQRLLVHRTGSHNRNRWIDLSSLLNRLELSGVLAGLLIVVVLVGSLDLAMRATATGTQPLVENSTFQHKSRTASESNIISVSKSSEALQGFVLETGSLSRAQIAPVPLPLRKPERVYKVQNGKGAKGNPTFQKRMAQQKRARPKPMR
jgi:hypothetical protein